MPNLETYSRLWRTLQSFFRINNIGIKDDSGSVSFRNSDDTDYIDANVKGIRLEEDNSGSGVSLSAPSGLSGDVNFVLPNETGDNGQLIQSDGTGILSFVDNNSVRLMRLDLTELTSDPLTIPMPPNPDVVILSVIVRVDVDATNPGPPPRVAVGTASLPELFFEFGDANLERLRTFARDQYTDIDTTTDSILVTQNNPNSKSFSAALFVKYAIPTVVS